MRVLQSRFWGLNVVKVSAELALANQVQLLIGAATSVSGSWIPVLIDRNLDNQGELRNRIFTIYVSGLMDACEGSEMRLIQLQKTAEQLNHTAALFYLRTVKCYIQAIIDLLSQFSAKEMAFIGEMRHQKVHGRWSEYSKDHRVVRYIENRSLKRIKVPADQYWAEQRAMDIDQRKTIDQTIAPLRQRLYSYRTLFWIVDGVLRQNSTQEHIYSDLRLGKAFASPKIVLRFENDDYWDTIASPKCPQPTLYQYRRLRTIKEAAVRDPVLPCRFRDFYQQLQWDFATARGVDMFSRQNQLSETP
jgi:hypothetical protein